MNKIILCVAMVMIAFSCSKVGSAESGSRFKEKVGKEAYLQLKNSYQVFVVKVAPTRGSEYVEDSASKELSLVEIAQLKRVLLNDSSYSFDKTKKCLFIPEVAYKFQGVTIYMSHFCNQIRVVASDKNFVLDYDSVAESLNGLSKKLAADLGGVK